MSYVVIACFIAGRLKFDVLLNRGHCQACANNRSSGLICEGAENASVDGLSVGGQRNGQRINDKHTKQDQDGDCCDPEVW